MLFYFIKIVSVCTENMCKYDKYVKKLLLNFVILKVQLKKNESGKKAITKKNTLFLINTLLNNKAWN